MHWRWLVPLPLAALLCGEAVRAPRLKPVLAHNSPGCAAYPSARERYLLAYAYGWEQAELSRSLLSEMESLLKECKSAEAEALRARAAGLRRHRSL